MPVDTATFIDSYPEFAGIDTGVVTDQINAATTFLNPGKFGTQYQRMCFLWVAHYLYIRFDLGAAIDTNGLNTQDNQGVITSQSASTGGLTASFTATAMLASDNALKADFSRTTYGLQYMSYLRQMFSPIIC
jgi:hypothetical protein